MAVDSITVTWSAPAGSHTYDREDGESLADFVDRIFADLMLRVPNSATEVCSQWGNRPPLCTTRAAGESKIDWLRRHKTAVKLALSIP